MNVQKLNHGWVHWQETQSFSMEWKVPESAQSVTLPHDAMIHQQADPSSTNGASAGYRDGGVYAYARTLHAPPEWRRRMMMLKFEGVYMHAMVYVNGQLAAKQPYGYTGFYVPLNNFLRYGQDNEIRVVCRNGAMKNSRWYTGAGIYRDVYLLDAPETHIQPEGVQITAEYAGRDYATLSVAAQIINRCNLAVPLVVEHQLLDPHGAPAAFSRVRADVFAQEQRTVRQRITVDAPALWSAEHPALYTCITRLYDGDTLLDEQTDTFGIRTLLLDARRGLRVNGETVKLRGACIHHDSGLLGAATWEDAQWRQVAILKEAGFNAIRMSHHPMAPAMLRACDALGMYVMDEVTDMWTRLKGEYDSGLFFAEWWPRDVEAMVRKDYNHPSVVMYSIGNEIPEIGTPNGAKIAADMAEKVRSLDHTRFVTAAINGIFTIGDDLMTVMSDVASQLISDGGFDGDVNQFMDQMADYHYEISMHPLVTQRLEMACPALDVAGYNYMTSRFGPDGERYPHRVLVGSETFAPDIPNNWRCVMSMPHVLGDFCWTGWDYLGESGAGFPSYEEDDLEQLFPAQICTAGDIDATGMRKPTSFFREMVFGLRKKPCIGVQPVWHYGHRLRGNPWQLSDTVASWTWRGYEGKPCLIEVFSPGEEVELLLNGRSLGRKPAGNAADFCARFDAVYQPGEITAVCYENGVELGRETLTTAQGDIALRLQAEKLPAGTDAELAYVSVTLSDCFGNACPEAACALTLQLSGGELLGFGSGDPRQCEVFSTPQAKLWRGRALAIIRRIPGETCTVTVEGEGCGNASITL